MSDIIVDTHAPPSAMPQTPSPSISSTLLPLSVEPSIEPIKAANVQESTAMAKDSWRLMLAASEQLAVAAQGGYSNAIRESMDYAATLVEAAQANLASATELTQALMAAKAPTDVVNVSRAHAVRQLELMIEQNRRLWMAAQKIARGVVGPSAGHSEPR